MRAAAIRSDAAAHGLAELGEELELLRGEDNAVRDSPELIKAASNKHTRLPQRLNLSAARIFDELGFAN